MTQTIRSLFSSLSRACTLSRIIEQYSYLTHWVRLTTSYEIQANTRCMMWMNEQKKRRPTEKRFLHCIPFVYEHTLASHTTIAHSLYSIRTHNTFGSWLCDVIRVAAAKWIGRIIYFIQFSRNVNVHTIYIGIEDENKFSLILKSIA